MKKTIALFIMLALFLAGCEARGGGWIPSVANAEKKATFGFQVKCTQLAPDLVKFSGQLEYNDHPAGVKFHAEMQDTRNGDAYSCDNSSVDALDLIQGTYRMMPSGQTGIVYLSVFDGGKSGDSIMIQLVHDGETVYENEGVLSGGNLQVR